MWTVWLDCYPTLSWLQFEPGPFCSWVQHTNHSATQLPDNRVQSIITALESLCNGSSTLSIRWWTRRERDDTPLLGFSLYFRTVTLSAGWQKGHMTRKTSTVYLLPQNNWRQETKPPQNKSVLRASYLGSQHDTTTAAARAHADINQYLAPALLPAPGLQQSCCCISSSALAPAADIKQKAAATDGTDRQVNRQLTVTYTLYCILCGQHQ